MNGDTTEEIGEEVGLLILESKLNILTVYSIDSNYFSIVISEIKNSQLTKVSVSKTRHHEEFRQLKGFNPGPPDSMLGDLTN